MPTLPLRRSGGRIVSDFEQAVRIIATIVAIAGLCSICEIGIRVFRSLDHNESHDWSGE